MHFWLKLRRLMIKCVFKVNPKKVFNKNHRHSSPVELIIFVPFSCNVIKVVDKIIISSPNSGECNHVISSRMCLFNGVKRKN